MKREFNLFQIRYLSPINLKFERRFLGKGILEMSSWSGISRDIISKRLNDYKIKLKKHAYISPDQVM
jgi:hypothetical protein